MPGIIGMVALISLIGGRLGGGGSAYPDGGGGSGNPIGWIVFLISGAIYLTSP